MNEIFTENISGMMGQKNQSVWRKTSSSATFPLQIPHALAEV
jgi:hypothetical protein